MSNYSSIFWENVTSQMKFLGWDMADLSRSSGLSKGALSKLQRDDANPTLETIKRIADGLNCDPWKLLKTDKDQKDDRPTVGAAIRFLMAFERAPLDNRELALKVLEIRVDDATSIHELIEALELKLPKES